MYSYDYSCNMENTEADRVSNASSSLGHMVCDNEQKDVHLGMGEQGEEEEEQQEENEGEFEFEFDYESAPSSMASPSPVASLTESDIELADAAELLERQSIVSAHRRSLTANEINNLLDMSSEAECSPIRSPQRYGLGHNLEDYYLSRQRTRARVRQRRAALLEDIEYEAYRDRLSFGAVDEDISSSTSPSRSGDENYVYESYCFDITL